MLLDFDGKTARDALDEVDADDADDVVIKEDAKIGDMEVTEGAFDAGKLVVVPKGEPVDAVINVGVIDDGTNVATDDING